MALLLILVHGVLLGFLALLVLRAVLSWVPLFVRSWEPQGAVRVVAEFVLTLTDPPVRALQRFLPPVRVGGARLDTAFVALLLGVVLLLQLLPF